jgi:uncharacterized protein (TIGR01777 family)
VVTGATGLLGRAFCERLTAEGIPFRVLSRNPARARKTVRGGLSYHQWETMERGGLWVSVVDGARAVVHLASPLVRRSRWGTEYKQVLYDTCVVGTQGLVSAVAQAAGRPPVFVSASTVGYYPPGAGSEPATESSPAGPDFLGRLAADWEAAAAHVEEFGVRCVLLRSGLILARRGALRRLRWAARLGLGGPSGPAAGGQPWIHLDDAVGLILLAVGDEQVRGPLNCVAPELVNGAQLMAGVRAQMRISNGVRQPRWMVPGAVVATAGRSVAPGRALALGYDFRHPRLGGALAQTRRRRGAVSPA